MANIKPFKGCFYNSDKVGDVETVLTPTKYNISEDERCRLYELNEYNGKYENAVDDDAIIAPSSDLTVEFIAEKSTTTQATYKVTIAFAWGEAFDTDRTAKYTKVGEAPTITPDSNLTDNVNPYVFYNTGKTAADWGDDANYYLNLIELMSTLTYNVTVTATPKNV